MRNALTTLFGLSAVGSLLLAGPTQASRRSEMEKSLLGIRVLQSYRVVLARFGQPTRIYRYGETVHTVLAVDPNGRPTGGIRALEDSGNGSAGSPGFGGGMSGAMGGMAGGMPGMAGRMPGMPGGMSGSMPMSGSFPGAMAGGGSAALSPMMKPGMAAGGGFPGMPGNMAGMPGAAGGGLGANNVPQGGGATFAQSGGFMWVYFYPKQELLYWFLFNTDGRVVAIVEKGRNQGKPTSRGISLGDSVKSVYTQYGWPDALEQQGDSIALHYNLRNHVQFHIINNKVTEIAIFLTEDQHAIESDSGATGGGMGGPGMAGRGLTRPGMAGGGGLMRPGMAGGGGGKGGEGGAD